MKIPSLILSLMAGLMITASAGTGASMKCASDACGYESTIIIGGGMLVEQVTGYCRTCKTFVHHSWARPDIPEEMKANVKTEPKPKSLAEVWNSQTGKTEAIYGCPKCNTPFIAITSHDDIKCCPKCNKPGFAVDPSKPLMIVD